MTSVDLFGGEEAVERVTLPIDSKAMEGLGKHHTLSSAIADLIDNSISAEANAVLVRFLQSHGSIVGVQIVDNGKGMTPQGLRDGMTVGRRRDYRPDELGHFGMGLKASSLSQANVLSVWTRAANNDPTGMRMTKDSMMNGAQCDILSKSSALAHLYASDYGFDLTTGTVVQWSDVHGMSAADNLADQTRWFENALVALKLELSVIFHRLLETGAVDIYVDVFDADKSAPGLSSRLEPTDPFDYRQSAHDDYPMKLVGHVGDQEFTLECHILPAGGSSPSARLLGKDREHHQGIFVYRRDRLQHLGGWPKLLPNEKALQLARVIFDVGTGIDEHVKINPEKTGVQFTPALTTAIDRAVSSSGVTFRQYLDTARAAFKESNRRTREHRRFAPMGRGFSDASRTMIASNEKMLRANSDPIQIGWKALSMGLYEIDLENRTIYLNQNYREVINGGMKGAINDAQLVKTLLFLLLEEEFLKSHLQKNRQQDHFRISLALEHALRDDVSRSSAVHDESHDE
ncbi:ATP-binding protein [Pseudarthrobacter sulfonivorans]|uniref:ATP-binding protein n=1 Tax=Pseudarthrobacter sulfonivorans TaxID=121292 RepID=UPI0021049347|nr:ATP-binding protein [Pseudarthrobacter sulfonivorans]